MSIRLIEGVYMADTARVMGDVVLAHDASIWYGVVIRGDVARITVGEGSNVQDNAVIHCQHSHPNVIGRHVTIGHGAVLHGELVDDGCLIGIGARLLDGSRIGKNCLVAAGAVVPPGMMVPDGMVVMGIPGKVIRPTNDQEKEYLRIIPPRYLELARLHHAHPEDPRVKEWGV